MGVQFILLRKATVTDSTLEFSLFFMNWFNVWVQITFLSKIQNRISEKTRRKIILLSCKKFVKTQFLGVVVFPSIFWFQNIKVVVFPSNFLFQNLKVVVFPSNFWKTTMIWQFFTVILNFSQECYYLKNKVGVVDF